MHSSHKTPRESARHMFVQEHPGEGGTDPALDFTEIALASKRGEGDGQTQAHAEPACACCFAHGQHSVPKLIDSRSHVAVVFSVFISRM